MNRFLSFIGLVVVALSSVCEICASETSVAESAIPRKGGDQDKNIESLVVGLISPNPKPLAGEEYPKVAPFVKYPEGYDREKQRAVRRNYQS